MENPEPNTQTESVTSPRSSHRGFESAALMGHVCMFAACAIWGLMAPLGKHAMTNGVGGLEMVTMRVVGGAACFWLLSLFVKNEQVRPKDLLLFFFAALLGIVFNQCCYTIGLSLTSPINASIMTTMMPIITMVLAAIFLREPITSKKVLGIFCGAIGALILIGTRAGGLSSLGKGTEGSTLGDLLCLGAQLSFAIYLTLFKYLIQRYSVVTCMKWMITYAAIVLTPVSFSRMAALDWAGISTQVWLETAFVVVGGTFIAYILMMHGQKTLRPTVVSMYNYVQPIVACLVSVWMGVGVFGWSQSAAIVLVFTGVWLVTQSKSRRDMKRPPSTSPH